jgi:hypothetical protein
MIEIGSQWKSVTDKEKWATRGASFLAKAKATKVVWFPPKPEDTANKAAATAKRGAKKATGTAKKTTTSTKKVSKPVPGKKA